MSTKYELVILGSGGVGKSAITIQFIQGNFVEKYDPTIEDSYRKDIVVDGESCMLDILDTAGQEEYEGMRDEYMRSGKGFILVYSITDPASLEDLYSIHKKLLKAKDADDVPVILVGNKCDLDGERQVTKEQGEQTAKKFGKWTRFIEASAKSRINIDEIFVDIIRLINRMDRGEEPEDAAPEEKPAETAPESTSQQAPAPQPAPSSSSAAPATPPAAPAEGKGKKTKKEVSSPAPEEGKKGKKRKTTVHLDTDMIKGMSRVPKAVVNVEEGEGHKASIICYDFSDSKIESLSVGDVSELSAEVPDWATVRWVSIEGDDSLRGNSSLINTTVKTFGIHSLCSSDVANASVRPKVDSYPSFVHVVVNLLSRSSEGAVTVSPVNCFLFDRLIVSFLACPASDVFADVKQQISSQGSELRSGSAAFLLYGLLRTLANHSTTAVESYATNLENLEKSLLSSPSAELLKQVYVLRREVLLVKKHVEPMISVSREIESASEDSSNPLINPEVRPFFTSVKNAFIQLSELLDTYGSLCDSLVNIKPPTGKGCSLM